MCPGIIPGAQGFYLEHQEDISRNFVEYRSRLHGGLGAFFEDVAAFEGQQSKHIGNLVKQRIHEDDIPGIIGDGVALMSGAHPRTVVTHLEGEKERNERIWKATKVASGG